MTNARGNQTAAMAAEAVGPLSSEVLSRRFRTPYLVRRLNGRAYVGLTLLGLAVLAAILAPLLAPHDPELADITLRLKPPVWSDGGTSTNLLGTDALGRDLLSRVIFGARISLSVCLLAVALAGLVGVTLGLLAGFYGGIVDNVVMRLVDIMFAFPFLLLAITWMAIFSPGQRNVVTILVLTGWATFCRMVRGQVLAGREREYVMAARVIGASNGRLIARHILPNLLATITVVGTMMLAQFILAEAALSFLGLGVEPQTPTWGGLVNEGREYISTAWWIETFPGLAIVMTVSGIGLLGDWLRDVFDPRLRVL
ncbi:MAG: peptide/nickel transport system permease protein [Thermomicrobiales bacterium]|nr:peptide/nickel transport system permease protein [Thermomicrobiales bacterium]